MISTAVAIQNATGDAVTDISTMVLAKQINKNRENMTEDEFIQAIWEYSAHLASLTATLVTSVCLTKGELDDMVNAIKEIEELGNEAL
jgi:hypothetical protein